MALEDAHQAALAAVFAKALLRGAPGYHGLDSMVWSGAFDIVPARYGN
jgi:hypothetical protein